MSSIKQLLNCEGKGDVKLSSAIRRFEKGLSPETMNTIWNVVFGLTYLNYDTEQDFTEQFSDNATKVMKLISVAEGTKGES